MTEYDKGYKEGYEACKKELAENPLKLYELLSKTAEDLKAKSESSELNDEQKSIFREAIEGNITPEQFREYIKSKMQ